MIHLFVAALATSSCLVTSINFVHALWIHNTDSAILAGIAFIWGLYAAVCSYRQDG